MSITPSLPQLTTTPPPPTTDPPRRRFGSSSSKPTLPSRNERPSSSSSTLSFTSPGPALVPPSADIQRARSGSSASSTASGPNTPTAPGHGQGAAGFDIGLAADKAQQWLSTWAPRGEGRSREFFANTLNGVANVASQVSSNLNREGFGSRSNSFASATTPSGQAGSNQGSNSIPSSPEERFGSALSISPSPAPPSISHTTSTPALPQRKIPQPANLSRLGQSNSTTSAPTTTSALTTKLNGGSTSSLPLHGPSHLNPNAPPGPSGHRRNSSTTSNPAHKRTSSFGISLGKSPSISRSSSLTKQATTSKAAGMPYKIGFQPQGVKNDRTEEFLVARKLGGEEREREEGRLGRRWAKLVDLHFNPTVPNPLPTVPTLTRSSSSTFSISSLASGTGGNDRRRSLLSIDGALDALKPRDVWKGFKSGPGPGGEEGRKRAAEQAIVKWEDDGEVKKCRICQSSFSLSNRKHHCRLCGRIICSLPPTPPALLAVQIQLFAPANPDATSTNSQGRLPPGTRREKCSLLLVADWKTGRGEEVEEGFVGWMKTDDPSDLGIHPNSNSDQRNLASGPKINGKMRRSRMSTNSISSSISEDPQDKERDIPLPQQPKEVQVKGCRVCRECWAVVSRKQKMQDRQRVTGFARLYSALRGLQSNIEELMPEFEDLLADLTESDNPLEPSPETLSIHKQLLTLLTQYEHLSKRIGGLNCEEGSSQAIVQSAVARSAAGFLAREMVKLQTLQKLQKRAANAKRRSMRIHELSLSDSMNGTTLSDGSGTTTPTSELLDKEIEDVAVVLQPLLEQEAQLEVYISDANAQRKYEDSKALNEALREIRLEIERITRRAR